MSDGIEVNRDVPLPTPAQLPVGVPPPDFDDDPALDLWKAAADEWVGQRAALIAERDAARADLAAALEVVKAAEAFTDQFTNKVSGFPRRDALVAAVDAYRTKGETCP